MAWLFIMMVELKKRTGASKNKQGVAIAKPLAILHTQKQELLLKQDNYDALFLTCQ